MRMRLKLAFSRYTPEELQAEDAKLKRPPQPSNGRRKDRTPCGERRRDVDYARSIAHEADIHDP